MTACRDERQLVAEVQAGSREAFERLLDLYEDKVYGLACRMVGRQEAEDVAQDALIQIYKSIGGFQGRSSLSTWIYRVSMNVCLEHMRRRRPEYVSFDDDLPEEQAGPEYDPAEVAERNESRNEIVSAIGRLPDIHRAVVVLHELQGLTYQECAAVLGCPVGTVKSRLSNAFIKLRSLLKDRVQKGGLVG